MKNKWNDTYEIIVGGGPVGCYLAYHLLKLNPNKQVILFENRLFERPQVVRIPFAVADDFPENVKNTMWCDLETRARIFEPGFITDKNFWPNPGYTFWPVISISAFQTALIDFLKTDSSYKDRFYFIPNDGNISKNNWQTWIEKTYPDFKASISISTNAIYCTCGTFAKTLREELNIIDGKPSEMKGHGIYLIYRNKKIESYKRDEKPISSAELGNHGITYVATNNTHLDVQLYTYPEGDLAAIFEEIPDDFIKHATYKTNGFVLNMTGNGLTKDAKKWFERYKAQIIKTINTFQIAIPEDLNQIRVFYAPRTEYYWNVVATNIKMDEKEIPLFFLGDSAGGTDYKSGLSMGRGMLSSQVIVQLMKEYSDDFSTIIPCFQEYWENVLLQEFNKSSKLSSEPWIQYHYLMKGRKVIYQDKTKIHYQNSTQYQNYLNQYKVLVNDF